MHHVDHIASIITEDPDVLNESTIAIGHATIKSVRDTHWVDANLDVLKGLIRTHVPSIALLFKTTNMIGSPSGRSGWGTDIDMTWASQNPEQVFEGMKAALFDSEDFDFIKGSKFPFRYFIVPLTKDGIMEGMGHFMGMYFVRQAYDEMAKEIQGLGLEIR